MSGCQSGLRPKACTRCRNVLHSSRHHAYCCLVQPNRRDQEMQARGGAGALQSCSTGKDRRLHKSLCDTVSDQVVKHEQTRMITLVHNLQSIQI